MSGAIEMRPADGTRLEVRSCDASFVATKTITVSNEYGKDETLKAGVTFVHDARHFPRHHLPAPCSSVRAPARQLAQRSLNSAGRAAIVRRTHPPPPNRPSARCGSRWSGSTPPRPRPSPSHIGARLPQHGRPGIRARGQVETGGALFGVPACDRDDHVWVARAGEPGPKTRTSESRMWVDCEHIRREAVELQRADSAVGWVGHWHTHPGSPDSTGEPSRNDLKFSAWDCRELHRMGRSMQHYVGLILTPTWEFDRDTGRYASWARPTFHAWHMQAVADDQFICTRAEVVRC